MKLRQYNLTRMPKMKVVLSDYETRALIGGASLIDEETVALSYSEMIMVYGNVAHFPSYVQDDLGVNPLDLSASELNILSRMTFEIRYSELDPFFIAYWELCSSSSGEGSDSSDEGGSGGESNNLFIFVHNITEDLAGQYGYSPASNQAISFQGNLYSTLRNMGYVTSDDLSYTLSQDEGMNFSYRLIILENDDEIYNEVVSL